MTRSRRAETRPQTTSSDAMIAPPLRSAGLCLAPRPWLAAALSMLLAGCTTSYFHDDRGASKAVEANKQLTDVAGLKPFDDQLANLAAFAPREDQAVARYWVVARDATFTDVLKDAKQQDAVLKRPVDDRLGDLAPAAMNNPASLAQLARLPDTLGSLSDHEKTWEETAAANLKSYRELNPGDPRDCKTLETLNDAGVQALRGSGSVAERSLVRAAKSCVLALKARADIAKGRAAIPMFGGALSEEYAKAEQHRAATAGSLSERAQALKKEIDAAEQLAKTGDAATLETFRSNVAKALAGPSEVIKAAGWKEAQKEIDGVLRGLVCVAPKEGATDAERTAAKCDAVEGGSTTQRAEANFKLLQALVALADTTSPKAKQAQWLLAARAIVAAEQADAKLKADLAQEEANISGQRLAFLLGEASTLASVELLYAGKQRTACRGLRFSCGFAAFVSSWNDARIPAEILPYHIIQAERLYAVRRSRAIAEKQRALALAGTGALDSRYAGGIQPTLAAQLLFDAGIFAAQVGN